MRTVASWPSLTSTMSVSSTSSTARITDRSAIVISTVPGLFIVPMSTVSPASMLRRVIIPDIGASIVTLLSTWRALRRFAVSCSEPLLLCPDLRLPRLELAPGGP